MRFWTLAANPGAFRVEDNVREQDEELWRTNRDVARGDKVAIYKYKGRENYRGIVSLGEVLTDPQIMYIPPGTDPYEVISSYGRPLPARAEWSWVRYVRAPRMPLWADLGSGSVVDELAVARAQGGTVHQVTSEQWERLVEEAGLAVWPPDESAGADAIEDGVEEVVRERGKGQGPGLSATERALVERRAMEVATRHFQKNGWTVEDVSAASPYDLLCRHEGRMPRRVEVKGATGGASAVILTRNEVLAARADPEAATLAIVHGIMLDRRRAKATGGILRIINPWNLDDVALTPIAYRYEVPMR
jgi:uncharacterized protein DUF3883/EVE domain-containing protein